MAYRILTMKNQREWEQLLQRVDCSEIFFSYPYFKFNERESGYVAEMFVYEEGEDVVIYPYLKIPLHTLPFFSLLGNHGQFFDLTSLEYGGPIVKSSSPEIFQRFLWAFTSYCTSANIVTEFIRLYPFLTYPYPDNTEKVKETYFINLQYDLALIQSQYRKSNRNCLARAQREGVVVVRSKEKKEMDEFYSLYMKTMKRKNARPFYLYSREYIDNILIELQEASQLFVAYYKEEAVSAAVFLCGGTSVHYYLAGSKSEYGKYGGSNSILHAAIQWAKAAGFQQFNLGSGYRPGDSLSQFKSSFTKEQCFYWRYRKIHLPEQYIKFTDAKEHYDALKNVLTEPDFFPKYRG